VLDVAVIGIFIGTGNLSLRVDAKGQCSGGSGHIEGFHGAVFIDQSLTEPCGVKVSSDDHTLIVDTEQRGARRAFHIHTLKRVGGQGGDCGVTCRLNIESENHHITLGRIGGSNGLARSLQTDPIHTRSREAPVLMGMATDVNREGIVGVDTVTRVEINIGRTKGINSVERNISRAVH